MSDRIIQINEDLIKHDLKEVSPGTISNLNKMLMSVSKPGVPVRFSGTILMFI